jgi:glycerophosphoryl diester phosphodiesterase
MVLHDAEDFAMLIARAATALSSIVVFGINGGMSTPAADPVPACSFRVIAHRGTDAGVTRNNTVAAFAQAGVDGADVVEMDIRLTAADSEGRRTWVVNHDEKIRGHQVSGTTFRLLRDLQPDLATFSEAAGAVAAAGARIEVELKPERVAADRLDEVLAVLTAERLRDAAVLTSAHRSVLTQLEPLAGPTQLGIIIREVDSPVSLKKVADRVLIRHNLVTADFVSAAHAQGLAVEVWTVDDAGGWRTVSRLGVDGVITDKAAAVTAWCAGSAAIATP